MNPNLNRWEIIKRINFVLIQWLFAPFLTINFVFRISNSRWNVFRAKELVTLESHFSLASILQSFQRWFNDNKTISQMISLDYILLPSFLHSTKGRRRKGWKLGIIAWAIHNDSNWRGRDILVEERKSRRKKNLQELEC